MAGESGEDDSNVVAIEGRRYERDIGAINFDVSGEFLEGLFDLSQESIRRLANDDKLAKVGRGRYRLIQSIQAYVASLRDVAAGRGGEKEQTNLAVENALLARARREAQELKNEELRGKLLPANEVERAWSEEIAGIRTAMLTVPSRVAFALPHLSRKDLNELDAVLRRTLEDAAHDRVHVAGDPIARPGAAPAAGADEVVDVD